VIGNLVFSNQAQGNRNARPNEQFGKALIPLWTRVGHVESPFLGEALTPGMPATAGHAVDTAVQPHHPHGTGSP